MKPILKISFLVLLIAALFYVSCKKEFSCENCQETNKSPIANAGRDTMIVLPVDSTSLDGNASSDPDGTITGFQWTKISGPASFIISNTAAVKTVAKNLATGIYRFELKITDDGGLIAKDTMQVFVDSVVTTNHPPVANAGIDQTISIPTNTVDLDGSGSTDLENNITSYAWTKISGPSLFNIANSNATQTQATNLVQGVYQFELKVTDAGGLFAKDTMQVTVKPAPIDNSCDISNRPVVPAQLIPFGMLSQTRDAFAVATAGNKIVFAGGSLVRGPATARVDIYDLSSGIWTTAQLSEARLHAGVTVLGNRIFFGGGIVPEPFGSGWGVWNFMRDRSSAIDIYDISANSWGTEQLSRARCPAGASAANKVFFAGGEATFPVFNNRAFDAYDAGSNTWSGGLIDRKGYLSQPVVAGNKIYYAGGLNEGNIGNAQEVMLSGRIDIYDASSGIWSVDSLSVERADIGAILANNKIYWAGGFVWDSSLNDYSVTNAVEIRNLATNTTSIDCLSEAKAGLKAARKDNKIIFFGGSYFGKSNARFDIYDLTTNSWSIGVLSQKIAAASIISVDNTIYIAGGYLNGVLSNQVWKLEF